MARVIAPYATQEHGSAAFDTAVEELIERIYERHEAAAVFAAAAGGA